MRLKVTFSISIIVLMVVLVSSCKKDSDEDELIWPEPYVPEWLVPFMGPYCGTYNGDDDGTWTCYIEGYTAFYIQFVSSADSSLSFYMVQLTDSGSFSNYGGGHWIALGTITETGRVSGNWQNLLFNTQGEFTGDKTP